MRTVRARWWWLAGVMLILVLGGARLERHFHHHVLHTGDRLLPLAVSSLYGDAREVAPSGRPTLINVFATWCTPCREETPGLVSIAPMLRARGIDVVGIDQQENAPAVSLFAQHFAVPYPLYIDSTGVTHDLLGARMIPTTMFIDARGVIRWEHAGPLSRDDFLRAAASFSGQPG